MCPSCSGVNDYDARFCKHCGATMVPLHGGCVRLTEFSWNGERVSLEDEELHTIAKKVHGRVDLVLLGRGDPTGVRIVDGTLTRCDVRMRLEPRTERTVMAERTDEDGGHGGLGRAVLGAVQEPLRGLHAAGFGRGAAPHAAPLGKLARSEGPDRPDRHELLCGVRQPTVRQT
jgi:hypothetical protein